MFVCDQNPKASLARQLEDLFSEGARVFCDILVLSQSFEVNLYFLQSPTQKAAFVSRLMERSVISLIIAAGTWYF